MDPTKLLDLERRTGVKNSDIDDFVSKASEVEAAVKAMLEVFFIIRTQLHHFINHYYKGKLHLKMLRLKDSKVMRKRLKKNLRGKND